MKPNYSQKLTHTSVWHVVPERIVDARQCEVLISWLSGDERARMNKFHAAQHRHAYLVGHALLRGALARELDCDPASLEFEMNPYGKPALAMPSLHPKLEFNLSHTDGLCVLAMSWHSRLGCDVESLKRRGLDVEIARKFFTPEESEEIATHPPEHQIYRLLSYWTLKEAYIKAEGQGLSMGLDSFYFHLLDKCPPRLMLKNGAQTPTATWIFKQEMLRDDFIFSLAVESKSDTEPKIEIKPADWLEA